MPRGYYVFTKRDDVSRDFNSIPPAALSTSERSAPLLLRNYLRSTPPFSFDVAPDGVVCYVCGFLPFRTCVDLIGDFNSFSSEQVTP